MPWSWAFSAQPTKSPARAPPTQTVVVHGEFSAAQALADALRQRLGWRVTVPEHGQAEKWPVALERP